MGKERNDFVRFCAFFALVLAALLIFVDNVLPLIGLEIGGKIVNVLRLIKDIALLLGIAFAAFSFAYAHGKGWKITYWVALIIYIASAVFGIF